MPADLFEQNLLARHGCVWVAGVDEVGRGPLAGPVVAAAVSLTDVEPVFRTRMMMEAGDSKAISAPKREMLAALIADHARVSVGQASVHEIDTLNIRQATLLAMGRAVEGLAFSGREMGGVLVDGRDVLPAFKGPQRAVVKGDAVEVSISCASLVAKVFRDRLMADLAEEFPGYGWEANAGYGTAQHLDALLRLGITPHHRVSFAPVRTMVKEKAA